MIRVEAIRIREFRGIRDLNLALGGKSFVVWGPNGSGKSGVVDALEFALTGHVSRLEGTGSGVLSLQKHGPHVHRRNDPAAAEVSVTVRDTATGKVAVLTRNVKTAKTFTLEPDEPDVRAAILRVQEHPELTLSRREVIKFILAEPGRRADEVQALLKLDRIGDIRSVLRTLQTRASSAHRTAEEQVKSTQDDLRRHLDISDLLVGQVTTEINRRRVVLSLPPLDKATVDTPFAEGVDKPSHAGASFSKGSALRDVDALRAALPLPPTLVGPVQRLLSALSELDADPTILTALKHRELVARGLAQLSSSYCPLCDKDWVDEEALRRHLRDKMDRSEGAARLQDRLRAEAQQIVGGSRQVRSLIEAVVPLALAHGSGGSSAELRLWAEDLVNFEAQLSSLEGTRDQQARLGGDPLAVPPDMDSTLSRLREAVEAIPDQSATAEATSFLIVAEERRRTVRLAREVETKHASVHNAASALYQTYCTTADKALVKLYETVQGEFSDYYRAINSDDEGKFKAELEPSAGKLDLKVDFYGTGMYPPTAFHSEGHQDGMGVCLYLALMKQMLRDDFTFAVLDDVVMSVDGSHRKQFCNLLRDKFDGVQFVITTHDKVWAEQMISTGLVTRASQARFHSWTVEHGPVYEPPTEVWDAIGADLAKDEVPPAAARLRRALESTLGELAGNLRGQVAYRPEGNYDFGDLHSATMGAHRKWLGEAAKAANSWNNAVAKAAVEELKTARSAAIVAQKSETWAINKAVHYNDWADFSKEDFEPVVEAWKQFLGLFTCSNSDCGCYIYLVGQSGHEEALRCNCGEYNLNLRGK